MKYRGGGINMNKIDTSSWKEFEISELFDIHPTKNLGLTNHELFSTTGNTPVVVNSSCNNGIGGYVDLPATEDGGIITFSDTTDANSIFYQKENFIGYSHVQGMYPKFDNNSDEIMQYIMTVFKAKALTKGYNYSNKFRRDDALKIKILLPAKTINEPDWQFMEGYIKEIQKKVKDRTFKQKGHRKKIDITTAENKMEKEWKKYRIGDLFKISLSKDDIQPKLVNEGSFPLVSSGKENNGICAYIEKQDAKLWNAGLLTVDMFGKVFYQEKPFYCVSHGRVNILIPKKDMSEMSLRFIGAVIEKTTIEKYNFQEMCTGTKLAEEFVFLPSGDNGQPDCDGIEKFMCSIADNSRDTLSRITLDELQDIYKKVNFASGGRRWKRFHLYDNELFSIDMGNKFDKSKMDTSKDEINFIGRTGINNGINALCGIYNNIEPYNAGYLTLSLGGSIGSCFIQNKPFYTSQNVIVLIPRNNMSFECKLFISVMIYKESNTRYKAFSDELNRHIKTDFEISLPVDSFGNPDWDYMENYIKELIVKTPKNIDLLSKVF